MRSFPDIGQSIEWNLVRRSTVTSSRVGQQWKIPNQSYGIENSSVCAVGVRNTLAKPTWKLGGWATQNLFLGMGYTSQFVAYVETSRKKIWLDRLNLLIYPKLADLWSLELSFPWWHEQMLIEVWRYDGRDLDAVQQVLALEQKLDSQWSGTP